MQQPFFKANGIDISQFYAGTLNVDLAPQVPQLSGIVFDGMLRWHDNFKEHFVLAKIEFEAKGRRYTGLWYYPDPATKVAHFQRASVVELLLPWVEGLEIGEHVKVRFECVTATSRDFSVVSPYH